MLQITIPGKESFDEETQTFVTEDSDTLGLEYSLVSISKWESKFEKIFLTNETKTPEENFYFIECMIIGDYDPQVLTRLDENNVREVSEYIKSKQSATTFYGIEHSHSRGESVSSELIYYWMTVLNIPFECEMWNFNRLMNLIKICNLKSQKQKKIPRNELARRNQALNTQRRAALGTTG